MSGRGRERGFTFVELLVGLAVGALVVAGLFQAFNQLHKWWITSSVTADQRQNARAALDTVTRDLEMAGYQTTTYGDPNKAGIAITLAAASEIEMDQQRPRDDTIMSALPVYEPRLVYYHLATDVRSGRQNLYRQTRTQPGLPAVDEIVAENVAAFSLAYYDKDGAAVAGLPPAAPAGSAAYAAGTAVPPGSPLRAIRRIDVSITVAPARAAAFGPAARNLTLTASVIPQNLATVDEVTVDTTPPAAPAGLAVVDSRRCRAKLTVRWNPSPEPDLAGYLLFYGPTGSVPVPLRALADKNNPEITLNPADVLITKNADRSTAPNTYAIRVAAYDSSGNHGAASAAVSGNPDPDVSAFGGANDSTVNPAEPLPPTGLTVTPGAEGELVVSWQAPADGSATAGFRLYRSTSAFPAGHVDEALRVAGEADLGPEATTFTDRGLAGCVTYHYAVASVNCDETLVATYAHDAANPAAGDYAVGSGAPTDATPPPAPGLAGTVPELQRILVTLTNPLSGVAEDFARTELFWSRSPSPAPVLDAATGAVGGGTHVPDTDSGGAGVFTRRGSQVVVFDSETSASPADPELAAGETYHLLAVAYDRCGNASTAASGSWTVLSPTTPCPDETDPAAAPPDSFSGPAVTGCQADAVQIGWSYPDRAAVPDLEGFRVARTGPDGTVELTDGPTEARTWTDAGPLVAGAEYTWTVTATDCSWEQYLLGAASLPYAGLLPSLTIGPVSPGGLGRYEPLPGTDHELDPENFVVTVSDAAAPYTHHNNVRLHLQNTSRSPVAIKRMAVSWDRPGLALAAVVVGGGASATTEQTVDAGGAGPGAAFAVNATIADVADGVGDPSGPVPLLLRFTNADGSVSRLADLRGETLRVDLWTRNGSLQDADCALPEQLAVAVPRGPVLGGFSQSAPGRYGIDSYAVPGPSGSARDTDVAVPYGIPVDVFGTAFDNSRDLFADGANRGFAQLKVLAASAPPAAAGSVPAMPTAGSLFERPLYGIGGDRYAIRRTSPTADGSSMPEVQDAVVWYHGLAVDRTGNWDRVPDPDDGAYAYYQPPFDVCTATPEAPVLTLQSTSPSAAVLSWTVPARYTSGVTIPVTDALVYDVFVKGAGGDPWPSTPAAAGLAGTSWTHAADLVAGTWYYQVVARNSCTSSPRASAGSNVTTECEGPSVVDCSLFTAPATARYGAPFAVSADVLCRFRGNGGAPDQVVFRAKSAAGAALKDFAATEAPTDTGSFARTVTAIESGTAGADQVVTAGASMRFDLVDAGGTTICADREVVLTGSACPTTPEAPVFGGATRATSATNVFTLTFAAPTQNADGSPLLDLAGYRLLFSTANSAPTTLTAANSLDLGLATSPWTGAVGTSNRYYFWLQAYDSCGARNYSANSNRVRANQ